MAEQARKVIHVFYAYACKDKNLRDRLEKHLTILKRTDQITSWSHHEIDPGKEWSKETVTHLNTAQIILLLISADFIASDYSYGIEMKRAIQRHEQGEACVIPIILRPVDLEDAPFSKLQALPANGRPVVKWENRDDAFVDIARGIRKTVAELRGARTNEPRQSKNFAVYKTEYYEEALAAYELAKGLDAQAYYTRGNILRNLQHYEEALAAYEMAVRLDPTFADAYHGIGSVHYALKQLDEALAAYEKAIKLNRNDSYADYSKAIIFYKLNNYKEAFTTCRQAISIDSSIIQTYLDNEFALEVPVGYQEALKVYEAVTNTTSGDALDDREIPKIENDDPYVRFSMLKKKLPGIIAAVVLLALALVFAILGFIRSPLWLVVSVLALSMFIFLAYVAQWEWTGLPEQKGPPGSKDIFYQGPKTAWDWLLLFSALAIPLVIAFGTLWFTTQQSQTSDMASMNQRVLDMQLATDQQQEMTLETYLDRMSDLLLNSNVHANNQIGKDIRNLARARTLTALPRLNPERKAVVLKFLYFTNLINRYDQFSVVNLDGADLSGADLMGFNLIGADLARVNLSGANLSGADLTNAYLPQANLSGADLEKAILRSAKLSGADLSRANLDQAALSGADFSPDKSLSLNAARLNGANLREARLNSDLQLNLPGANLSGVDLSGANLQGATVTNEQLAKASSLKCATLPDGTKNPC